MRKMKTRLNIGGALALGLLVNQSAFALELDPEVFPEFTIGGRAVVTLNTNARDATDGGDEQDTELDIGDSSLLLGFSKYLFKPGQYGYAGLGLRIAEEQREISEGMFVSQAYVGIGGPRYDLVMGRHRLPNTLLHFPVLREDDLLDFTVVANASSVSLAEEDQVFGNLIQAAWWWRPAWKFDAAVTGRAERDASGAISAQDFNGASIGVAYELPVEFKVERGLRYAALRVDQQNARAVAGLDNVAVTSLLAALSYHLNDDPEGEWVADAQAIVRSGEDVAALDNPAARARAALTSVAAALRYAHRPHLQTRWRTALLAAWQDYGDFNHAGALLAGASYVYRLGSGVDVAAQYFYRRNDDTLAAALGYDSEHRVQVGLVFAFDMTFNESVAERGGLLDFEHTMGGTGPAGFGE